MPPNAMSRLAPYGARPVPPPKPSRPQLGAEAILPSLSEEISRENFRNTMPPGMLQADITYKAKVPPPLPPKIFRDASVVSQQHCTPLDTANSTTNGAYSIDESNQVSMAEEEGLSGAYVSGDVHHLHSEASEKPSDGDTSASGEWETEGEDDSDESAESDDQKEKEERADDKEVWGRTLCSYTAQEEGELSFGAGEVVFITDYNEKDDSGWWVAISSNFLPFHIPLLVWLSSPYSQSHEIPSLLLSSLLHFFISSSFFFLLATEEGKEGLIPSASVQILGRNAVEGQEHQQQPEPQGVEARRMSARELRKKHKNSLKRRKKAEKQKEKEEKKRKKLEKKEKKLKKLK